MTEFNKKLCDSKDSPTVSALGWKMLFLYYSRKKKKKKKNPHAAKNLLPVERFFNTLVLTYSIYVN